MFIFISNIYAIIFSSLFSYCISFLCIPILNIYLNNYYDLKLEQLFSYNLFKVLLLVLCIMLITSIPTLSAISYIKGSDLLKMQKH